MKIGITITIVGIGITPQFRSLNNLPFKWLLNIVEVLGLMNR